MDPLLSIIKYLFKKKNIPNNDDTIDSFFKNGVSFPKLIEIIFDVDSIPGIKKNPKLVFQCKINNDTALQFLFFKNEKIKSINPTFETEKNQINLLQLIFTMQCFTMNAETIIEKSNKILEKTSIHLTKKNELISLKILSSIINSLSNGSFPISDNCNEIIENFKKFDIPLVFNEKCLDVQYSYIFLIQIQILFEFFENDKVQISESNQPKEQKQIPSNVLKSGSDTKNQVAQMKIPVSVIKQNESDIKNQSKQNENAKFQNEPIKSIEISKPSNEPIKSIEIPKPSNEPIKSVEIPKPSNEHIKSVEMPKPSNEPIKSVEIPKPSNEPVKSVEIPKPSNEHIKSVEIPKPSNEHIKSVEIPKPSNEPIKSVEIPKPSNEHIKSVEIPKPSNEHIKSVEIPKPSNEPVKSVDISQPIKPPEVKQNPLLNKIVFFNQNSSNNYNKKNDLQKPVNEPIKPADVPKLLNVTVKSVEIPKPSNEPLKPVELPKPSNEPEKQNEISQPIKQPDAKQNPLLNKIAFFNQNSSNSDNKKNDIPKPSNEPIKSKEIPKPSNESVKPVEITKQLNESNVNSSEIQISQNQEEEQILESRDDQIQRERNQLLSRIRERLTQYSNDRKLENDYQYSDEYEEETEINNQHKFSDDDDKEEDDKNDEQEEEQETEELSEDPEQLEKQFEKFQNFMSDISDEEEEIKEKEIVKKEEQTKTPKVEEEEEEEEEIEHIGSFMNLTKNMNKLTRGYYNFIGNLKNYINIDTVYKRLQVDKSTNPEKLWNIQIDNYNYDNGILFTEDKSKTTNDPKKVDQNTNNQNENTSTQSKNDLNIESNINDTKKAISNLYKIMKYDEQKYCWQCCESDLEKMVHKSNDNPTIPLILFIDSNMDDIKKVSSAVRKNELEFISDDEISLYSFWKETFNIEEYDIDFPNTITEPMFLYVYIPKSKEKHKNIGAILYQIYTFLFMICDLSIVILNDQHQNMQILLMKEIIDISKFYLYDSQIFFNKSKITFLHINKEDKSNELDKLIKPNINIEYKIHYLQNEKEFRLIFEDLYLTQCYRYSNLISTLNQVNSLFSQISSLYLYMRKEKNIYNLVKEILTKRYNALKEQNDDIIQFK